MTLGSINLVTVPVSDQDASRTFYVDTLGFAVKFDYVMDDGMRWLMLTPPGGGADITVVTWFGETSPPGSAKLSVTTDDADATYAELTAAGVKPDNAVEDAPWGRWFGLDDPDGNNWLVVQPRP
jgi:catechol 2,3-dioxygenase-like lactoylglutathione lyase family enzyme